MAVTSLYYGGFDLNNNAGGYFATSRPANTMMKNQTLTPFARMEGAKKNGEQITHRTIPITVVVAGSSRADLENKLDALYGALDKTQQQLLLHLNDGRYFVADAIYQEAPLGIGNIVHAEVKVTFVCQQPFAFAASQSSFDTGTQTYTLVSGSYNSPTINVAAGGNKFARPLITLTNEAAHAWTKVVITQQTDNQVLTFSGSNMVPAIGNYLLIQCDPVVGWSITDQAGNVYVPNGYFPTINPGNTPFLITISSGSAVQADTNFTWTARWLS